MRPTSPVCSQPSGASAPGATIGPRTRISSPAPIDSSAPGTGAAVRSHGAVTATCEQVSVIP